MWRTFTERARKAILYAVAEAERLGAREADTEHLLLGLLLEEETVQAGTQVWPPAPRIRVPERAITTPELPEVQAERDAAPEWQSSTGLAVRTLQEIGVSLDALKIQAQQQASRGDTEAKKNQEIAPSLKRVINRAFQEARLLKNKFVGLEHLLLGLIHEETGTAGHILAQHGVSLEQTRQIIWKLQGNSGQAPPQKPPMRSFRLYLRW